MLSYLFWHTANEGTDHAEYEERLIAFHDALNDGRPGGFLGSVVFRHYQLPWAPSSLFVYEDWYLVDSFEALGTLNEAAVAARRRAEHDAVAHLSSWGTGGLYAPREEKPTLDGGFTYWFSKPEGRSYASFYEELRGEGSMGAWQRQLVLGPAQEFCVLSRSRLELDARDLFESSAHTVYRQARISESP